MSENKEGLDVRGAVTQPPGHRPGPALGLGWRSPVSLMHVLLQERRLFSGKVLV